MSNNVSKPCNECSLYNNGHRVHWIPALRRFDGSPRFLVNVVQLNPSEGWFHAVIVESGEDLGNWWTHDPARLAEILSDNDNKLCNVDKTSFFHEPLENKTSVRWLCGGREVTSCL